jgi:hypothetical protein
MLYILKSAATVVADSASSFYDTRINKKILKTFRALKYLFKT